MAGSFNTPLQDAGRKTKIQVRRGPRADLPTLAPGELGLTTDTDELFIGCADGYNRQIMTQEALPVEQQMIFGVKWTKSSAASALTRTDDAVEFSFAPQRITASGATIGSSSFDDKPVYKDIRRCVVVNGTVTAYEGEPGFSMTPDVGDVMVEIPRFYYQVADSETELSIRLSDQPFEGAEVSPLHRPVPGNEQGEEKAYVSAYFLDETGRSSGAPAAKSTEITLPASWPNAARGGGWVPSGLCAWATILLLYLVEVADWNSQTAVCSVGLHTGTDINGKSGALGYHSGGSEVEGWCVYRGLENLWGKTPAALWGTLAFATTNLLYKESPWNDNAAETSAKVPLGVAQESDGEDSTDTGTEEPAYVDTGSGYLAKLVPDGTIPGILIPNATSATAGAIPDQYVTSGLGDSLYLTLYWGAVSAAPAAPVAADADSEIAAGELDPPPPFEDPEEDGPGEALTPLGAGGIFSLVSALNLECFYRLTYLPAMAARQSFTATFTGREGNTVAVQELPVIYPIAEAPAEPPTWEQGFFTGWSPDPRLALICDTVFTPQFVLGKKEELPTKGTYDTLDALQAAVTAPAQGDMYEVGAAPPYKVYIYVTSQGWVDTGLTQS